MEEEWKKVKGFPLYEVSNLGNVRRIGNTWNLSPKVANGNTLFVKLSMGDSSISKSVKTLVAEAFVPKPEGVDSEIFDTPIQCVLNTEEIRADKIMWRPRWFAIQFRRQLNESDLVSYWDLPVMNVNTGDQHASILTAALREGLLMKDIFRSAGEGRTVFPTGHRYIFLDKIDSDF